ncbi:MAG: hypothetical protein A4E67_02254 [Syntrophaceae bacterium PtaB.Bin038]|nr:MAG: hypothetical protein A4E67_02254 [Syntrophaceae bacterium PtaB.Bin038]
MKIHVSLIPEEGRRLQYTLEGDWYRDYLQKGGAMEFRTRPAEVSAAVHKVLDAVTLDIRVETALDLDCGRCLESFRLPVRSEFRYTLVPSRDPEEQKEELSDEDISFGYYRDDLIDLNALVYEQILLQVPMKPLCAETCRGLCAQCGANLNAEPCGCKPGAADGRLGALKNFKARKQT